MKVLCLYNHAEYGAPMVRAAPYFAEHGIEMEAMRLNAEAQAYVAYLRLRRGTFDVLLLQEPPVTDEVLYCHQQPVILLERVDGAQLRASRLHLANPRVVGVIKSYVFRDRSWYNEENDRAHIRMLHEAGIECKRPLYRPERPGPQLADSELAKLRVGYSGFLCHNILKACIDADISIVTELDFRAYRPIDVFFAGTVDYEGTEVDTHRRLTMQVAETWPGKVRASAGRRIRREQYYAQMQKSKIALCPWGWGEATYREYEAMAMGAVVLKPDSSHVESWPDVYRTSDVPLYVPCKPDWSDAHEKIEHIIENWRHYTDMREIARDMVVEAWQPESIAERMAHLIKELVG